MKKILIIFFIFLFQINLSFASEKLLKPNVNDDFLKILLNHHKVTDMWFQFGGHSDKNSNSYEVAKREVFEESGISDFVEASEKSFDADHHVIVDRPDKNEPSHYHYDINFLFVTDSDYFKLSNESSGAKWVTLEEAKQLISPDDISMKRMLAKYELYLKNKK